MNCIISVGGINVLFQDQMGIVDFYPSGDSAVIYINEGDLVLGGSYKRKIVKLRKASETLIFNHYISYLL